SSRACPASRNRPVEPMNFSAFHSGGLWLAVMAMPPCARRCRTWSCTVGTGHTPISITRLPVDKTPATTACLTISPEVRGSRPMTIVPDPVCVPNACAKRVRSFGVSDCPTTPRTPEILIFNVGIARMVTYQRGQATLPDLFLPNNCDIVRVKLGNKSGRVACPRSQSLPDPVSGPVEQLLRCDFLFSLDDDAYHRLRIRSAHVDPARRQCHLDPVRRINFDSILLHRRAKLLQYRVQTMWLDCNVVLQSC